jgi:hypothetical protein
VHVHQAIDLDNRGELDETGLDGELLPYLNQWRLFLQDTGLEVIGSELRVFHGALGYAGTADVTGIWRGETCVVDVKTGWVPRSVGAQLAAYREAMPMRPKKRLCVQLTFENYRLHECKNPGDFSLFQSCLNIWRFKNAA